MDVFIQHVLKKWLKNPVREVDEHIREIGEQATFEVGVHGLASGFDQNFRSFEIQNKLWSKCIETFHGSSLFSRT